MVTNLIAQQQDQMYRVHAQRTVLESLNVTRKRAEDHVLGEIESLRVERVSCQEERESVEALLTTNATL